MKVTFQAATEDHARYIGERLRQVDIDEITRAGSMPPLTAPLASLRESLIAWTLMADGRPVAIFGVAAFKAAPRVGIVWLLGTDEVSRVGKAMVRGGRYYVGLMSRLFPTLINAIDPDNITTRGWLAALGFTEAGPHTMPSGAVFTLIRYERPHV